MNDAAHSPHHFPVWRDATVVTLVAMLALFLNLGSTQLWDRDEPRNAGCALEMAERGDWVVPVFNGELRTHKPVLLYWLMMSAYAVFGVNEFAARCWSALLGVGTCLLTCDLGRRLYSPRVGRWAGVILATSLMFDVAARAATPDSVLIFCGTLAMWLWSIGSCRAGSARDGSPNATGRPQPWYPQSLAVRLAMFATMGLAVLAKGPVGCVLPMCVIGLFLLIMRLPPADATAASARRGLHRWMAALRPFAPSHFFRTALSMSPLTAALVVLAVAAPWYAWAGIRSDGAFLEGFFLDHHLGRATQPMEGHGGSLLYYPAALLVGFFPWSVFAVPTLLDAGRRWRGGFRWQAGSIFAACWVGVYVAAFSIARTKLPSYVTPCYPALALLTAGLLAGWIEGHGCVPRRWATAALAVLSTIGLAMGIAAFVLVPRYLPGEWWLAALGMPLLLGAAIAWWLFAAGRTAESLTACAAACLLFAVGVFGFGLVRVDRYQQNAALIAAAAGTGGSTRLAAYGRLEPSWVFYARQPIVELQLGDSETSSSVLPDGQRKKRQKLASFLEGNGSADRLLVITTDRHYERLAPHLPRGSSLICDSPLFLRRERLLLIGSPAAPQVAVEDLPRGEPNRR